MKPDSPEYLTRKREFSRLLQIYGRKAVLEILLQKQLEIQRIHLARNSRGKILQEIRELARQRKIEIVDCDASRVSQISRNAKQDQGIVADLRLPRLQMAEDFLAKPPRNFRLLALDGVTTPANVGMIIRSLAASALDGLLLPRERTSGLNSLVIKASAGTVFRCPILRCGKLEPVLKQFQQINTQLFVLDGQADRSLFEHKPGTREIYLLGGESEGVADNILQLKYTALSIPMHNGVESLNVAVAASIVAFEISRRLG